MTYQDRYDLPEYLFDTPEEVIDGEHSSLPPLRDLRGRCLNCGRIGSLAKFRFLNELVRLPDGSKTSADEWMLETLKAKKGKGNGFDSFCDDCQMSTVHVAEGTA